MEPLEIAGALDIPGEHHPADAGRVDPTPLLGTWINTNDPSRQRIAKIVLSLRDGALIVHPFARGATELHDWGEVEGEAFADSIASTTAMSFMATYDFGFLRATMQVNVKRGVMVIATCSRFTDGSPRSNYYTREFFYQVEDGAA